MRLPFTTPLLVLAAGCALSAMGCAHGAGTFEDEPGNWQRAFRTERPSGVEVVRSSVVRLGSGGTLGWFELRATPASEAELFANDLEPVPDAEAGRVRALALGAPRWFAPEPVKRYAVWWTTKEILPVILVFRDRESGALFVHLHPR